MATTLKNFLFTLPFIQIIFQNPMPRQSFTAIDFETATSQRSSICQVGLVRVIQGKVVDQINVLVRPPHNTYHTINTSIHGITPDMTSNALTFDQVWNALEHYIAGQHVVAHNMAFDKSCLTKTLKHYHIPLPTFQAHCTYKLYSEKLSSLCLKYQIELRHHDAQSDALACALLFKRHLNV